MLTQVREFRQFCGSWSDFCLLRCPSLSVRFISMPSFSPQSSSHFAVFRDVQIGRGLARAGVPSVGDVLPAVHRVRRPGPQRHIQLDQRLLQSWVSNECSCVELHVYNFVEEVWKISDYTSSPARRQRPSCLSVAKRRSSNVNHTKDNRWQHLHSAAK